MHPLKSIGVLGLSPIFQTFACRVSPFLSPQDLRLQHLPSSPLISSAHGDLRSASRSCSTSIPFRPPSKSPGFDYRVAASFSAKHRRFNPSHDAFFFDPAAPEKEVMTGRPVSGQDAFFASRIGNSGNIALGVADGVGGWADSGIDSAHVSHGLCRYMGKSAREMGNDADKLSARNLLQKGYDRVVADRHIPGGGTTACVAIARNDGYLEVANLGDSGFVQLRLNAVHYYSNPQIHAFNTPYQLSIVPPKILAWSRAFGGGPLCDYPRDASVTTHQARHGDVLVFATDGVWDNLSALDMLRVVSRQMKGLHAWVLGEKGFDVGEALRDLTLVGDDSGEKGFNTLQTLLAVNITAEAKSASLNTKADGPFAREAQKFYPHDKYHGGKVDDICVVVAVVIERKEMKT